LGESGDGVRVRRRLLQFFKIQPLRDLPVRPVNYRIFDSRGGSLNQRRQHVVDRAFQARVAASLTAIAALVPFVLIIGGYLVWTFAVAHNSTLAEMPIGWKLFAQLLREQWWLVLLFVVSFVAFSFAIVFYNTHRIAGPVYRFRWLLDELSEGRIHTHVRLRKGDFFENLASSIVRANATLASTMTQLKDASAAASADAAMAGHPAIEHQMKSIQRALDRYTVIAPVVEQPVAENPAASDEGEAGSGEVPEQFDDVPDSAPRP